MSSKNYDTYSVTIDCFTWDGESPLNTQGFSHSMEINKKKESPTSCEKLTMKNFNYIVKTLRKQLIERGILIESEKEKPHPMKEKQLIKEIK